MRFVIIGICRRDIVEVFFFIEFLFFHKWRTKCSTLTIMQGLGFLLSTIIRLILSSLLSGVLVCGGLTW